MSAVATRSQLLGSGVTPAAVASQQNAVPTPDVVRMGADGANIQRFIDLDASTDEILAANPSILASVANQLRSNGSDEVVQYLCERLIDLCQRNTAIWRVVYNSKVVFTAAVEAFSVGWTNSRTNDGLAYIISALLSYDNVEPDSSIVKAVADPTKQISSVGRLMAIANLLRLSSIRTDLCCSSSIRNYVSRGLDSTNDDDHYAASLCFYYAVLTDVGTIPPTMAINAPLHLHRTWLRNWLFLFQYTKREKVIRVGINIINILIHVPWVFEILAQRRVDTTLLLSCQENFRDADLPNTISSTLASFESIVAANTNYERYVYELKSGRFTPGPLHSEKFWSGNYTRFEDNTYDTLIRMVKLLYALADGPGFGETRDIEGWEATFDKAYPEFDQHLRNSVAIDQPNAASIAYCQSFKGSPGYTPSNADYPTLALLITDLGEFALYYTQGKQLLTRLGVKNRIIALMESENKDVARESLLTTQKLILTNWRAVA